MNIYNKLKNELLNPISISLGLFFTITVAMFGVYKLLVLNHFHGTDSSFLLLPSLLFGALAYKIRISDSHTPTKILLRAVLGLFGVYLLLSYPTMMVDELETLDSLTLVYGRYLAVVLAAISCFFPAWGLFVLTYVIWYKSTSATFLGQHISYTDYMPLIEIGMLLVFGTFLSVNVKRIPKWLALDAIEAKERMGYFFILCISVHMANYFYSGVKKITLDVNPISWVFDNQTHYLLLNARELGQLPIGFLPDGFIGFIFQLLDFVLLPMNAVLLVGQLLAIVALFRIKWAAWMTLFYDLTHIIIFIVSGIFFYKWIVLNTAVVMALHTMKGVLIPNAVKVMIVGTIILSPAIFFVAKLGWWDTSALNVERFYAVKKDGTEVALPSNYFGQFSVRIAQQRYLRDKGSGFVPTGTYGIIFGRDKMLRANKCDYDLSRANASEHIKNAFTDRPELTNFIQKYHRWLGHRADNKIWAYNLYPHHIFSFPWTYEAIDHLKPGDIISYKYKVTSVCLPYKNGMFVKKELKESYYDIPLK